jgi:hypothetical protein
VETAAKGSSTFERVAEIKAAQHPADGFLVSFYLDTKTILCLDDFEFADHFFHRTVSPFKWSSLHRCIVVRRAFFEVAFVKPQIERCVELADPGSGAAAGPATAPTDRNLGTAPQNSTVVSRN